MAGVGYRTVELVRKTSRKRSRWSAGPLFLLLVRGGNRHETHRRADLDGMSAGTEGGYHFRVSRRHDFERV